LIYDYIANNLVNEPAAHRFQSTVKRKLSTVSTFPKCGTFLSSFDKNILAGLSTVRKITANNYVILYEYYEENDVVVIGHIFHQMQDYGKLFQK